MGQMIHFLQTIVKYQFSFIKKMSLTIFLFLLSVVIVDISSAENCVYHGVYFIRGGEAEVFKDISSWEDCEKKCLQKNRCRFWTYAKIRTSLCITMVRYGSIHRYPNNPSWTVSGTKNC